MLWPYRMKRYPEEYYRIITSGFVHVDVMHLMVNMLTFYFFSRPLIQVIGPNSFVLLYLSGIIVANLPSVFKQKDMPERTALGASGGVAAIVFATIYLDPWQMIYLFYILPLPSIIFAIFYVWYSYRMKNDEASRIGHEAHLWGAIYGFVYMTIFADPAFRSMFIEKLTDVPFLK